VALSRCAAALLLLVLAGCGRGEAAGPENVEVSVGAEQVAVRPTQYCLDGDGQRYSTTPPIIEVSPDSPISLTVPESVAEQGWSVQVFDEKLEEPIGEVDVPEGESVLDEINTSDVVPPAFYLVVVEDKGGDCGEFSGAWPVGFLRAGGDLSGTPSSSAPPAG
jgi:glucose/arabinose dehydrogenase